MHETKGCETFLLEKFIPNPQNINTVLCTKTHFTTESKSALLHYIIQTVGINLFHGLFLIYISLQSFSKTLPVVLKTFNVH